MEVIMKFFTFNKIALLSITLFFSGLVFPMVASAPLDVIAKDRAFVELLHPIHSELSENMISWLSPHEARQALVAFMSQWFKNAEQYDVQDLQRFIKKLIWQYCDADYLSVAQPFFPAEVMTNTPVIFLNDIYDNQDHHKACVIKHSDNLCYAAGKFLVYESGNFSPKKCRDLFAAIIRAMTDYRNDAVKFKELTIDIKRYAKKHNIDSSKLLNKLLLQRVGALMLSTMIYLLSISYIIVLPMVVGLGMGYALLCDLANAKMSFKERAYVFLTMITVSGIWSVFLKLNFGLDVFQLLGLIKTDLQNIGLQSRLLKSTIEARCA